MAELQLSVLLDALREDTAGVIRQAEADYVTHVALLAEQVVARRSRVVLLAGPSGSGKTTTSNMLADQLRREGHEATVISLDDFYRSKNDPDYPLNDKGQPDYEAPESLRLDLVREAIREILSGAEVHLPRFNFKIGMRHDRAVTVKIPDGGCAIIEGLHALNPLLTDGLATDLVTKVFVSVSTNISIGDDRILSGRKIRFIRRMSRDYLYRAADAARTLSFWQGVLAGEDKYLYPYKETADFRFDTFHFYEIGVMKRLATQVMDESPALAEHPFLLVIRRALSHFPCIPLEMVPETSLLREFLPGGIYEHLY